MPVYSIIEADECLAAEQLLLTIGRTDVLSIRADCRWGARYVAAAPRSAVRTSAQRPRSGSPISYSLRMALCSTGPVQASSSPTPPMRWRACKRRSPHEHRRPQARAGSCSAARSPPLTPSQSTALDDPIAWAERTRRADARSLAARRAALRRAATAAQCDATERQVDATCPKDLRRRAHVILFGRDKKQRSNR